MAAAAHSGQDSRPEQSGNRRPARKANMTPKTKVFHVITKLELGGAQKVTLMTLERLPRTQYDLGLVTGPDGLLVDWANRIPSLRREWNRWLVREIRPVNDALAFLHLWRLFRRERPQIVHTHSTKAGLLGRWA